MRRLNSSQVEIFNFSFLDILACTIALLIFIMVMVFVLQSGSTVLADTSKIAEKTTSTANAMESQAAADEAIAARLESESDHMASMVDHNLLDARTAARTRRQHASDAYAKDRSVLATLEQNAREAKENQERLSKLAEKSRAALVAAQIRHDEAERRHATLLAQIADSSILVRPANPPGDAGADSTVLHIDCQRDKVVVMRIPASGKPEILGSTSTSDIDSDNSVYMVAISKHRSATKPVIVFWVRPDGIETFSKAREKVPEGVDLGYEPADADWKFDR